MSLVAALTQPNPGDVTFHPLWRDLTGRSLPSDDSLPEELPADDAGRLPPRREIPASDASLPTPTDGAGQLTQPAATPPSPAPPPSRAPPRLVRRGLSIFHRA